MRRTFVPVVAVAAALVLVAGASGHDEGGLHDHPAPNFAPTAPPAPTFIAGGPGAQWELIATVPTGNPHTDIDFFSQGGEIFMAAGTLAAGGNGGGQTIIQLTENGDVTPDSVSYVSAHPSATCVSNPAAALGLQHDVEATPKGGTILNAASSFAVGGDAQLLIDATDAGGRCHDQGPLGLTGNPRGGLELIDVTKRALPAEIGLTSHIGEAHTVNVDPKRPWIAYAVTSDRVPVDANRQRQNEIPGSGSRFNLDGFEVVDLSSCLDFPIGTTLEQKREQCRPEVYRYRWPTTEMALGHTITDAVYGCHELEVYANDLLTCGSGAALLVFDMSGAFDENGKPRGTPLPCSLRASNSAPPFFSGAMVVDCVNGQDGVTLDVPGWLAIGSPSLEGVRWLGSVHHQGRAATGEVDPPYHSPEDIDFNHEAELSGSERLLIATDERGGGVAPPGASCSPEVDITAGNGGVHFYRFDRLTQTYPSSAEEAFEAYARTPAGEKAVYRAPIRTQPQADLCTAHVFHQIPGQNRIFMGWYTQGTQVVDFVEHADGSVEPREAGWFIPTNANTWVSAVFKMQENADGTFTYWGATGDFNLGTAGRNAVDVWKVTLPAPPRPLGSEPEAGEWAQGAGWLHAADGKKINVGFKVEAAGGDATGELRLNDKGAGVKIDVGEITSLGAVEEPCGTIADGPTALQFRGTGTFNGAPGKSFRVCVHDGGKGAGATDRFVLECTAGCSYSTVTRASSDALGGGNVKVHRAASGAPADGSEPETVILDPLLATGSVVGAVQTFTVEVLDATGSPAAGASVSLRVTSPLGVQTLTAVTEATGLATFLATGLLGTAEYVASAGGVQSNAIELTSGG
jgi:hypothetical protein